MWHRGPDPNANTTVNLQQGCSDREAAAAAAAAAEVVARNHHHHHHGLGAVGAPAASQSLLNVMPVRDTHFRKHSSAIPLGGASMTQDTVSGLLSLNQHSSGFPGNSETEEEMSACDISIVSRELHRIRAAACHGHHGSFRSQSAGGLRSPYHLPTTLEEHVTKQLWEPPQTLGQAPSISDAKSSNTTRSRYFFERTLLMHLPAPPAREGVDTMSAETCTPLEAPPQDMAAKGEADSFFCTLLNCTDWVRPSRPPLTWRNSSDVCDCCTTAVQTDIVEVDPLSGTRDSPDACDYCTTAVQTHTVGTRDSPEVCNYCTTAVQTDTVEVYLPSYTPSLLHLLQPAPLQYQSPSSCRQESNNRLTLPLLHSNDLQSDKQEQRSRPQQQTQQQQELDSSIQLQQHFQLHEQQHQQKSHGWLPAQETAEKLSGTLKIASHQLTCPRTCGDESQIDQTVSRSAAVVSEVDADWLTAEPRNMAPEPQFETARRLIEPTVSLRSAHRIARCGMKAVDFYGEPASRNSSLSSCSRGSRARDRTDQRWDSKLPSKSRPEDQWLSKQMSRQLQQRREANDNRRMPDTSSSVKPKRQRYSCITDSLSTSPCASRGPTQSTAAGQLGGFDCLLQTLERARMRMDESAHKKEAQSFNSKTRFTNERQHRIQRPSLRRTQPSCLERAYFPICEVICEVESPNVGTDGSKKVATTDSSGIAGHKEMESGRDENQCNADGVGSNQSDNAVANQLKDNDGSYKDDSCLTASVDPTLAEDSPTSPKHTRCRRQKHRRREQQQSSEAELMGSVADSLLNLSFNLQECVQQIRSTVIELRK